MEKDLLAEVIEAERDIQRSIEREEAKAKEWLEARKLEISRDSCEEERRMKDACALQRSEAERAAAERAADIVQEAEARTRRLRSIGDEALRRAAERHLARILPE